MKAIDGALGLSEKLLSVGAPWLSDCRAFCRFLIDYGVINVVAAAKIEL